MYKLKKEYKGCTVRTGGYSIILDDVKSENVEKLGLEDYFTKSKEKKTKNDNNEFSPL
tara:strand:- start:2299 stop:2472 length:174 start_codon:yes stop_codon:yes gene_type:complete